MVSEPLESTKMCIQNFPMAKKNRCDLFCKMMQPESWACLAQRSLHRVHRIGGVFLARLGTWQDARRAGNVFSKRGGGFKMVGGPGCLHHFLGGVGNMYSLGKHLRFFLFSSLEPNSSDLKIHGFSKSCLLYWLPRRPPPFSGANKSIYTFLIFRRDVRRDMNPKLEVTLRIKDLLNTVNLVAQ